MLLTEDGTFMQNSVQMANNTNFVQNIAFWEGCWWWVTLFTLVSDTKCNTNKQGVHKWQWELQLKSSLSCTV
jgi:hypothetical protein